MKRTPFAAGVYFRRREQLAALVLRQLIYTVTGVVKEFQWVNPHTWLHLTVDDRRAPVVWLAEGRAPGILLRAGWTRSSLKSGETVTVDMSPAKDGTTRPPLRV